MTDPLLNELHQEAAITRRVLERVPGDKLEWRPHPKSMSLSQLAMHVASIPGNLSGLVQADEFDASQANFTPPAPGSVEEILTAHDSSLRVAQDYLGGVDEQTAQGYSVAMVCPMRNTRLRRYRSRYLEAWLAPRSQWEPGRWRHYQWPDYLSSSGSHIR